MGHHSKILPKAKHSGYSAITEGGNKRKVNSILAHWAQKLTFSGRWRGVQEKRAYRAIKSL